MSSEKPSFWSLPNLINVLISNWNVVFRAVATYLGYVDSTQGRTIIANQGSANQSDDVDTLNVETIFTDPDIVNRLQQRNLPASNDGGTSSETLIMSTGSVSKTKKSWYRKC